MAEKIFRIQGNVIDHQSRQGIANLRVEAWSEDLVLNDLVGSAITDEQGAFQMQFDKTYFRRLFQDRQPALFFKIFRGNILIKSTEGSVLWNVDTADTPVVIEVDLATAEERSKEFVVQGQVRYPDGKIYVRSPVLAFDKDLRSEECLGGSITDQDGRYRIAYTAQQFGRAEKKSADLVVRAYPLGVERPTESPIIFNAQPTETVDLVIGGGEYRGPSEFEQLLEAIAPLLEGVTVEGVDRPTLFHKLADLKEDEEHQEITFISSETEIELQRVTFFVTAAKLALKHNIPPEVFYGLFRQGLPMELPALLAQSRDMQRRALEMAVPDNTIPEISVDEMLERLQALAVEESLEGNLGNLFRTSPILEADKALQRAFIDFAQRYMGTPESFWEALRERPEFKEEGIVEELKFTLDLSELTQNYLPLVQLLQQEMRQPGDAPNLRDLARFQINDWRERIEHTGTPLDIKGETPEEKVQNYANTVFRAVESKFPTAVIVNRLRGEEEKVPGAGALIRTFDQNNEFELATADIDRDLGDADKATKDAVRSWQRVFRVSPTHDRYEVMKPLKAVGLDSAQSIVRMGQSAFIVQYADMLGKGPANEVWDKSSQVNALALMLFMNLGHTFNQLVPKAVPYKPVSDLPPDYQGKPTLEELFGSLDFCHCEHCKSVYSPAAYFVDLLQFLKTGTKKDGRSPLTVLLGRRPDLTEIELSCENTNTQVPYVDLVNEVLENAATRFALDFSIPNMEDLAANNAVQPLFDDLRRKFKDAGYSLTAGAKLAALEKRHRWVVIDGDNKYVILREKDSQLYVYALLNNQTRAKEEELSVQPEHINPGAYLKLAQAFHPWNLPFDLWWEEARIYMKHLGFDRYAWIEKLPSVQAPKQGELAHETKVACDHLGLTTRHYELIAGAVNLPETELWGIKGKIETLCDLKLLLKQAGFDSKVPGENFKVLRQLVHAYFIDPGNTLAIQFQGDPCDLKKATLIDQGAKQHDWAATFNCMRRFLRLQRTLDWTIPELDKAIASFKAADLDETLIRRLSNLERLRTELNVPRLEMLSWWGAIDTAEDRSEDEESKKSPSLYAKVFLNKAVDNPANALFELNATRTELKVAEPQQPPKPLTKISDNVAAVAGALEISVVDLKRLIKGQNLKEEGLVDDVLNLENLGSFYRVVSLSKVLKLKIKEFLAARVIIGIDPFVDTKDAQGKVVQDRTANARKFVKQVREIQASAFTILELDYLLRHRYEEASDLFVPTDAEIARVLGEIASGLVKIAADAALQPDPEGELTSKRLALLLDHTIVEQVLQLLRWKTVMIDLPQGVVVQSADLEKLKDKVTYDKTANKLRISGALSDADKKVLDTLSQDAKYLTQIKDAYNEPRTFLDQNLKEKLKAFSWLTDTLKQVLDQKSGQQERFDYVLNAVNEHLCRTLSENLVKERLAGALSLDADVTALLLEKWVKAQVYKTKPALADFLALAAPKLSEWDLLNNMRERRGMIQAERSGAYIFRVQPDGNVKLWVNDRAMDHKGSIDLEAGKFYGLRLEYPAAKQPTVYWQTPSALDQPIPASRLVPTSAITSFRLLHKCTILLGKLKIRVDELNYLAAHGGDFKQFDLNSFPLTSSKGAPLYEQWRHLNKVFTFRDKYSQAKVRLIDVFAAAQQSPDDAKKRLLALTDWNEPDFDLLTGQGAFNLSAEDLKSGGKFDKLHGAFTTLKRLGISAEQLIEWVSKDLGAAVTSLQDKALDEKETVAQSLKQAVKAKYDHTQWLKVGKPLRDGLREKQRAALVAFLVQELGLKDANELYERFLIDVEMSPCMMTSRIMQVVSVVQLFVQRSLMGLETEVSLSAELAKEWKWRRNYRVWEANRKVFLYPENWVEPELRDDKSPFFEELENEILQNEITDETVEDTFLHYLEKLKDVARLEILAMFDQHDEWYEWREGRTVNNVIHVFGRTRNTPHVYYYRRWIDESHWTPWQKIDIDVDSDHLIPVSWNRRLYLFWPIFEERSEEREGYDEPGKYWSIQLAWSEYKNGKWSAKRTSLTSISATCIIQKNKIPWVEIKSISEWKKYQYKKDEVLYASKQNFCLKNLELDGSDPSRLLIRCYVSCWELKDSMLLGALHWPIAEFQVTSCDEEVFIKSSYLDLESRNPILRPVNTQLRSMKFEAESEKSELALPILEQMSLFSNVDNDAQLVSYQLAKIDNVVLNELDKTCGTFKLLSPHQEIQFDSSEHPFFYEDQKRTFFVIPECKSPENMDFSLEKHKKPVYFFYCFYHAYLCPFFEQLSRYGMDGLLDPKPKNDGYTLRRQLAHISRAQKEFFKDQYDPTSLVSTDYPVEDVDFVYKEAYAQYNWEIFFHAPLLIADRLSKNQRFEEAMKWFHFIFDPTETADGNPPLRYWKVRPFYEMYLEENGVPKRIQELMVLLSKGDPDMEKQVAEWRKNPFKPHAIARLRLPAYMNSVVMKYIDNLIAWGDQLFRQYTLESINEATQLYILAAEILGTRPEQVPAPKRLNWTYRELEEKGIDVFSNVLKIEDKLPASGMSSGSWMKSQEETLTLDTLFFCIPHNDKLLKYWDTVADRLFKIRHCMTIEGKVRELPLFQPPIEPGLLVRAAAAGIDIASVLSDLSAPLPYYRFQVMAQKATELCAEVRSLGAALLSALEKQDAEELVLMRSKHELQLLKAVHDVKKQQIEESKRAHEGLQKGKELAKKRQDHYADLIKNGLNASEKHHLDSLLLSTMMQMIAQSLEMAASNAHSAPDTISGIAGWGGSPVALVKYGGSSNVGPALAAFGRYMGMIASVINTSGTMASIEGGFQRREEEWKLQQELATKELEQIDRQIATAEIRVAIAETELKNHELQTTNAKEVDTYMRSKFTKRELYGWMVSQLSTLYFQSYQLAYDIAKRAERAYRHELDLSDSDFIKFGYWDSLKKGLLSGEKLHYDLKRMEVAYLEQNAREYEIIKHVSLALLDPLALIKLKETGECFVSLPEAIFDLDYPGHYMRRIKSVGLTIPCVTGPYTGVNCTLTLLNNRVRRDTNASGGYEYTGLEDLRFHHNLDATQSITTSSAQNDSGLFELNFRDERYLPFEGAGAISDWRIELPTEFRQFDYNTISDVIFHIRYTAREGGGRLKQEAEKALDKWLSGKEPRSYMFSAKHDFSNKWHQFFQLVKPKGQQEYKHQLKLELSPNRFPYLFRHRQVALTGMTLFLKLKEEFSYSDGQQLEYEINKNGKSQIEGQKNKFQVFEHTEMSATGIVLYVKPFPEVPPVQPKVVKEDDEWTFEVKESVIGGIDKSLRTTVKIEGSVHNRLNPKAIEDLWILCEFSAKKKS